MTTIIDSDVLDPNQALLDYLATGRGFTGSCVTATAHDAFKKGVEIAMAALTAWDGKEEK